MERRKDVREKHLGSVREQTKRETDKNGKKDRRDRIEGGEVQSEENPCLWCG